LTFSDKQGGSMIRIAFFYLTFIFFLGLPKIVVAQTNEETTTVREFYSRLTGDWVGSYSLWLQPGAPAEKSKISAIIRPAARGNYFLMTYSWAIGDEAHEGVFLFGGRGKAATANWGDSFHSVPGTMLCKGELMDGKPKLILNGSYSAGDGPDWGWRTEFTILEQNSLLMVAYNVAPDGTEALAVKAELERVIEK
jgi:hypothetical protein